MCLLARVGLITPAAKEAAARRTVAMRMEEEMRRDRRAQWTASLAGPARLGKERRVPQDACVISPLYFIINMEL